MGWILGLFIALVAAVCIGYGFSHWDPHLRMTDAGPALIHHTYDFGERPVRVLAVRHGWQSGMRLDDPDELVFPYVRAFDAIFTGPGPIERVLCIGGGGFSYPRSLAGRGVHVDAVERDPRVVAIARKYFGLADAERHTDGEGRPLLRTIVADGMDYLNSCDDRYDALVLDAYDGMEADPAFASPKAIHIVKEHLAPEGVLAVNVASPREDPQALVTWANRLREQFSHVSVVSCTPGPDYLVRNHIVVASDAELAFDDGRLGPFAVTRV